jgi:hypothetical protein
VQALCITPTTELAMQITDVLQKLGKHLPGPVTAACLIKGVKYMQKITSHIVVGTPGKMSELIKLKLLDLSQAKVLVFDEADDMVMHFPMECVQFKKACITPSNKPRVLLFSASFNCLDDGHPHFEKATKFTNLVSVLRPTTIIITCVVDEQLCMACQCVCARTKKCLFRHGADALMS